MVDTLEELTADTLSRAYVERRLDDWARRIDDLFARITAWSAPDWTAATPRRTVRMNEEPMREVGLDPIDLPVLDLFKEGRPTVSIEPRSLWIIGANGRLELSRPGDGTPGFYLVDEAGNFDPPDWRIISATDRYERAPFDEAALLSIL